MKMSHYDEQREKSINTERKSNTPKNIRDLWQTPMDPGKVPGG